MNPESKMFSLHEIVEEGMKLNLKDYNTLVKFVDTIQKNAANCKTKKI